MFASRNVINLSPVVYDTFSNSSTITGSNSITTSWSHTASGSDRVVILMLTVLQTSAIYTSHTRTITYGGVAMASLGGIHENNNSASAWIEYFYLFNPATGSQTVSVTVARASTTYNRMNAAIFSYTGCKSVSTLSSAAGTGGTTALSQTITSALSERVVQTFMVYSAFQSGSISAYNQSSRYSLAASGGNNDNAVVVGDAAGAPSVTFTASKIISGGDYAQIAVRLSPVFVPFTEENVARTNIPIPSGASGCYVTLIGAGGSGGGGTSPGGTGNGGAGGGGGGKITRTWVPRGLLGSTYSISQGAGGTPGGAIGGGNGNAGGNSVFSSGSNSLTATGGAGGGGGSNATPTGGTGGAPTNSGITPASVENGQSGGNGGYSSVLAGQTGGGTSTTDAGAGGAGGGANITTANNGGAGGRSRTVATGGTLGTGGSGAAAGAGGNAAVTGDAGAGGGGGGGGTGFTNGGAGGNGGTTGAGGGGGGGKQGSFATGGAGGVGAIGYCKVEWVNA